jgi:excisionase family DNA binding protein
MLAHKNRVAPEMSPLPALRFEIPEAAQILRMSRAQLYNRIGEGTIRPQKDGSRTYITRSELERYVQSCV